MTAWPRPLFCHRRSPKAAGFVVKEFYSDAAGAPQAEDSPTLSVLLEKP